MRLLQCLCPPREPRDVVFAGCCGLRVRTNPPRLCHLIKTARSLPPPRRPPSPASAVKLTNHGRYVHCHFGKHSSSLACSYSFTHPNFFFGSIVFLQPPSHLPPSAPTTPLFSRGSHQARRMATRPGPPKVETALSQNIEAQVKRLKQQLEDLEEMSDDLDADEYESMKASTLSQLSAFSVASGNVTLLSEHEAKKNAKQAETAATSQAATNITTFKAGNVAQIRGEISALSGFVQMGKMTKREYDEKVGALIFSLQKHGERLTKEEQELLENVGPNSVKAFEDVSSKGEIDSVAKLGLNLKE